MHVRFDGGGVADAARHLTAQAAAVRCLVGAGRGLQCDVRDPALLAAVGAVGDVVADVAELVALDLELLGVRSAAAARLYELIERVVEASSAARSAGRPGR